MELCIGNPEFIRITAVHHLGLELVLLSPPESVVFLCGKHLMESSEILEDCAALFSPSFSCNMLFSCSLPSCHNFLHLLFVFSFEVPDLTLTHDISERLLTSKFLQSVSACTAHSFPFSTLCLGCSVTAGDIFRHRNIGELIKNLGTRSFLL